MGDGKLKRDFKAENFDYTTFSCTASKRHSDYVLQHSNLFCGDIDHIGNVQSINNLKAKIISLFAPALMFRSPSGDGLKVVYQIDKNQGEHLEYYYAIESFFAQELGIKIDKQCKDIVRACFLCHDPEVYFNEAPDTLDRSFIDTFQPQQLDSIPHNSIISAQSQLSTTTIEKISDNSEIIERLKTWLNKKETFIKGNRNNYITQFAGVLNRYGIPEATAMSVLKIYQESDFPLSGIEATVRSVYSKIQWHNTAKFDINIPCNFEKTTKQETTEQEPEEKQPETQPLPIEGMPEFIQDFINEYCRDFIAGSVIISTALGIGNKLELVGKYKNVPVLWLNFIGNVSSGKTHPLSECLSYFTKRDCESIQKYNEDLRVFNAEKEKPKEEQDLKIIEQELKCFQFILNDATPEASALAHSINNRGLCFYRDELKGWLDDFNKYKKSGEQSNMLSSWYQLPMTYNRKSSGILNIPKPCIFVAGGMQIDLLSSLAKDSRAENGFLSRFCNVFPDHSEKQYFTNEVLHPKVMTVYYEYLKILVEMQDVVKLQLSPDSSILYAKWFNNNVDKTNNEQSGYLKGVYGKLDVICLRLAIVLHGMWIGCNHGVENEISSEIITSAINLTEYFRATALKVYRRIFKDAGNETLNNKSVIHYCNKRGASQNDIAGALKVSQQYVQKILKIK
jgi:hypothetical protein